MAILIVLFMAGCAGTSKQDKGFFTSGNTQADQRAEQRMAKARQLSGEGKNSSDGKKKPALYDRLGAQKGLQLIVDDFVPRAMADPRVNWDREGVTVGGLLGIGKHSRQWNPTQQDIQILKLHMVQFLSVATGGPFQYQGQQINQVHHGMRITNAEFDAAVGDMKATLDKLQVTNDDQKELLAIIESTRPEIVEVR